MTIADVTPIASSRSTRGRVAAYAFRLNGETLDVTVQSAQVVMGEGQHDQAVLKLSSPTLEDTEGLADGLIQFQWGIAPHAEPFVGYVVDVKEASAAGATGALSFTASVLGPTKAMFEGTPRFWSNKSIPSAVRDLAARDQLGYTGHDHSHLWSGLAQTRESDWTFMAALANRIGWQVYNRYGVVMCYDPLKLFTESGIYARLVMGSLNPNPDVDRILLDFQPVEESEVLSTNLGRKFGYFTSNNEAQVATQPGEFRGYVFGSDVVIRDQDAAKVYTDAGNVDMDRWKQYALARVWGDADLYPGMCVEVVTTNKTYLRAKYDGKWLIRSASHQMDRQQYQTALSLARPSGATPVAAPGYKPFWQEGSNAGRSKPTLSTILATDMSKSRWRSSWAEQGTQGVP